MMKGKLRLYIALLLTCCFLSACKATPQETLQDNQTLSMATDLVQAHLQNISYEEQEKVFFRYREKISTDVWDEHYDLAQDRVKYLLGIAEYYGYVPKYHEIREQIKQKTEDGVTYLFISEMLAYPQNSDKNRTENDRTVMVYHIFHFDTKGQLITLDVHHKLVEKGGE